MEFESGHIYHIFNQGNDQGRIFFKPENYLFFLSKIKTHIIPFADILAWCLMPNHFHLMVFVKQLEIDSRSTAQSRTTDTHQMTNNAPDSRSMAQSRTTGTTGLNRSIGILLASYTQALNKQQNRSGSLFRPHTKAECLTNTQGISPSFFNTRAGTIINIPNPEKEYPQICFNYIHHNPVEAGLVKQPEDWEFSSYRDYSGLRKGKLVNKVKAIEFGLIIR